MDNVYLNGRLVPREQARISPFDRGFLYGDGFFETTRICAGAPLFLERHLERLANSCRETGFGGGPDAAALAIGVKELIRANEVEEGYLRMTVSRGRHQGRLTELETTEPTVLAEARPMELPPLDAAPPPITLARADHRRNEASPVVRHKSLSYQGNVLALADGRRRGADEVYFLNSRGDLAEGAISNLFFVRDGTLCTPAVECGLLPGITRAVLLGLCAEEGIPLETGHYSEADLLTADEAFCTNSLRGMMPVASILGPPDTEFTPGETTAVLRTAYAALCRYESRPE
ncbi:MAG: aminotransferase class IV [Candidatus Brocadiia bacterium]